MADQALNPDSFEAARRQGPPPGARPVLNPDSFEESLQAAPAAPQRPSEALPQPDQAVAHATTLARAIAELSTRPPGPAKPPMPIPESSIAPDDQSLWQRITAPVREGAIGRALGVSSETAEARREDPSNPLIRFEAATPHPGALRGAAEFASGLTAPENLILMAGSGGLGALEKQLGKGLVSRLVSAGFSASMLHNAYQQVPSLREAWNKSDWPQVRQQLVKLALGTGMAAAGARGALKGKGTTAPEEKAPPEPQYTITGQPVRNPEVTHVSEQAQTEPQTRTAPSASAAQGQPAGPAEPGHQQAAGSPDPAGAGAAAPPEVNRAEDYGTNRRQEPVAPGAGAVRGVESAVSEGDGRQPVRGLPGPGGGGPGGGEPQLPAGSAGPNTRRVTGSADLPLTPQGKAQARELEVAPGVQVFHAPNQRSAETGGTASPDAKPADWLEPWKLGPHEGKPLPDAQPIIDDLMRHPDQSPGGVSPHSGEAGEPFRQARNRLITGAARQRAAMRPGDKVLNITSGRAMGIIGGDPAQEFKPGQIYQWTPKGLAAVDSIEPGTQNFTTHAETAWNPSGPPGEPATPRNAPQPAISPAERAPGVPRESGPHGPIYHEFYHDAQGALAHFESHQEGDAIGALHHPDVGDFDLIGSVAAKLRSKHPEVLDDLQGFISGLKKVSDDGRTIQLRNDGNNRRAGVRLDFDGVAKRWLVTAFDTEARASSGKTTDGPETGFDAREGTIAPSGAEPITNIAPDAEGVNSTGVLGSEQPAPETGAIRQFWGDETGTSLAGVVWRQTKAEGDALRMKRDVALEAAKRAEGTPEQKKAGDKVRTWFTSEEDLWAARTNQITDIVTRKLVPKMPQREALAIMREFRYKPAELQQFIDGSHPDLQELKGGVPNAMKFLDPVQPLMRDAMRMIGNGMTAGEDAADKSFTLISQASLDEGRKGGWLGSRWESDTYVPHKLHPKGEGEIAREPSTAGRAMGGQIGKYFGFGERRSDQYPTLLHAIADGVVPKTLDPSALFTIHGSEFARARATHLLEEHLETWGLGTYSGPDRAPRGWEPLAGHTDEFQKRIPFRRQGLGAGAPAGTPREMAQAKIAGLQGGQSYPQVSGGESPEELDVAIQRLYVPPFIQKALGPLTAPEYLRREISGFAKFRSAQRGLKQAILGLSGFHLLTENVMAKVDIGPSAMYQALKVQREAPEFLELERDGIESGLATPITGKTVEAYKNLMPGTIPTRGEVIRAYIPGSKQGLAAADAVTRFTFENVQRRYKVWGYGLHRDAWMNENPMATPSQLAEAKRGIASYTNAVYGGLHWENMGIGKAMVEVGRALLLAPDWWASNIVLGKYALDARPSWSEFTNHPLRGALTKEAVQARLARRFWAKQTIQGLVENQMLSLMFSGQLSARPFQVYHGKDKDGRDIYQNGVFRGSSGDAISLGTKIQDHGLLVGAGVFVGSKMAPLTKPMMHIATGRDDFGRELTPKGMNWLAATVRSLGSLVTDISPIPIAARNLARQAVGDDSDKYVWSERILTLFGPPAQHVAPEGYRMGKYGLTPFDEAPQQSIWDEIQTGKR